MRRRGVLVVGLACAACGGPSSSTDVGTESGESGSETSETGETGEDGPLLVGEPSIIHHPAQPMVVDVLVELAAPGTASLVHDTDPGVSIVQLDPPAGEAGTSIHLRVRGLLPASDHPLSLTVSEADGDRDGAWQGTVTTDPALDGFIATFEIDNDDPSLVAGDMRLFDLGRLYSTEATGVYLVDHDGRSRWYLGDADDYTDLEDVWAGLRLRADGTLSYTRRYRARIVDELGEIHLDVAGEDIGAPAGLHHDLEELPNGNFLVLGYTFADVDYGGDEGVLHVAGDQIIEFTPAGEVVWTWNSFDHLDPLRRRDGFYLPQKIPDPDTGVAGYDWSHANGVVYDPADDTIYVSMRHQDWILAIDHASGEILWKLGDEGDFTLVGDEYWFFHQHSPQWQPDGTLLLYDNAIGNPARPDSQAHARAVRYAIDREQMTATKLWADDDPFFGSPLAGDADRMSNGNILRLDSTYTVDGSIPVSRLHELDPSQTPNTVWSLTVPPQRFVYRALPVTRWVGEPSP